MSNEIVPFSSADTASHHTDVIPHCKPQGSFCLENIPLFHKLGLGRPANTELEFYLIGDNQENAYSFPRHMGHKYVNQLNPTPTSVANLLEEIKDPSVLWLRGCDQLLAQASHFPFDKFKTLDALEISGITHLTIVPKEISEMTQLRSLNLSHLPILQFPVDDLLFNLTKLRSLILRGCSNLSSLPKLPPLDQLLSLDLSNLPIETLPEGFFSNIKSLRWLILRGCSKLHSLPFIEHLEYLKVLDLSHCSTLQNLRLSCLPKNLKVLDLSYTASLCTRDLRNKNFSLTHVFCRDAKGIVFDSLVNLAMVQVLDLSGAGDLQRTDIQLKEYLPLVALDLSRTNIESIDAPSLMIPLRILLLRGCSNLVKLPAIEHFLNLMVLDVSGCTSLCELPEDLCKLVCLKELNLSGCTSLRELRTGVFDQMRYLEKLDLSKTNINHLPSFANLISIGTLIILEIAEVASGGIEENHEQQEAVLQGGVSISLSNNPNEFHLVSTFTMPYSPFYRFKHQFPQVKDFILEIQRNFKATSPNTIHMDFGKMVVDLEYILDKIDLLESSDKGNIRKLFRDLMYAVENLKAADLILDSTKLKKLFRMVAKLKLLIPHHPKQEDVFHYTQEEYEELYSRKEKRDAKLAWIKEDESDVAANINIRSPKRRYLRSSYDLLTENQKYCLLYFAAFPKLTLSIKERILIQLWYGEGFIDPQQYPNTIEGSGHQILMVLEEKGFITRRLSEPKIWIMTRAEHVFVREQAKAEGFFDFDNDSHNGGKLTPRLTSGSQRACLLKSRSNLPSSCELWLNYCTHSRKLERCFKNVHTLLNVNECIINIRAEWFSKMTKLTLVHLGSWEIRNKKHIEVLNSSFLEELKHMKQLRILSLEGVAAIKKLPDSSICKLTNLKVLHLRDCSDLQELPASIGSLKNLSHLDLTNCQLLSMLPKGIKLLSRLEVLKGLVITYDAYGQQNNKACTLADISKFEKLRKLSLVVNKDLFTNSEDVQQFKEMKNLCKLQITWVKNNYTEQDTIVGVEKKHSTWKQFKCWEQQTRLSNDETKEQLTSKKMDNLKKLVLCCFPSETPPEWLNPSELHNLETLYILGGHLKTLPLGDSNQNNTWNVKALRLKHSLKLDMDWDLLRRSFPNMSYFQKAPLSYLSTFPVNAFGVWRNNNEKNKRERRTRVKEESTEAVA